MTIFHVVCQNNWSPLWAACYSGHLDIVIALIEAGADTTQQDEVSNIFTELHYFVIMYMCIYFRIHTFLSS